MLVKLMENPGKISNAVTISGVYIFDANNKRALCLIGEYFGFICAAPENNAISADFEQVYQSVRYINTKENNIITKKFGGWN